MKRTAYLGLSLLLVTAFATSAFAQAAAQAPAWNSTAEYDAYIVAFNEKDFAKKAALAEKFLADHPKAAAEYRKNAYVMVVLSYYQAKNWAKAMEAVDKMPQLGANLPADQKKQFLLLAMSSAAELKDNAKLRDAAERVLTADPNEFNALFTLSGLLSGTLPTDETAKNTQITRTLEVTTRALKQPKPAGVPDGQWNPIQVQLNRTVCLMLLNQKKYTETIAACQTALKINPKDGDSYYLMGLAMKPELVELVNKYNESVNKLNENRTADQITRDELMAVKDGAEKIAESKKEEIIGVFAKAVAAGGGAAAQAKDELSKLFTGTPDEMNALIASKKSEL
jgi:tetratricopeptide (TPR) repeat protein